ncbi:MAG: hypothetical protein ABFC94_08680 [Syntrophomonas sp.]
MAKMVPVLQGRTTLEIPPFGKVSAATHQTPAEIRIRLEQVETDTLRITGFNPLIGKGYWAVCRRVCRIWRLVSGYAKSCWGQRGLFCSYCCSGEYGYGPLFCRGWGEH